MNHLTKSLYHIRKSLLTICISLWLAAFVITHIPLPDLPSYTPSDKTMHFVGYFMLTAAFLLVMLAYRQNFPARTIIIIGVMISYAAMDEITQPLVNRTAAMDDFFADLIGSVSAVILGEIIWRFLSLQVKGVKT